MLASSTEVRLDLSGVQNFLIDDSQICIIIDQIKQAERRVEITRIQSGLLYHPFEICPYFEDLCLRKFFCPYL